MSIKHSLLQLSQQLQLSSPTPLLNSSSNGQECEPLDSLPHLSQVQSSYSPNSSSALIISMMACFLFVSIFCFRYTTDCVVFLYISNSSFILYLLTLPSIVYVSPISVSSKKSTLFLIHQDAKSIANSSLNISCVLSFILFIC